MKLCNRGENSNKNMMMSKKNNLKNKPQLKRLGRQVKRGLIEKGKAL